MKRRKILAGAAALAFLFLSSQAYAGRGLIDNASGFYPAPELLSPLTDDIDLSGKDKLEFRWRQTEQASTDHYEFKLYQGYNAVQSTLLLKQDIPASTCPFFLPAADFQAGQVYTWALRQVYLGGAKGDRAYGSFKVIKK